MSEHVAGSFQSRCSVVFNRTSSAHRKGCRAKWKRVCVIRLNQANRSVAWRGAVQLDLADLPEICQYYALDSMHAIAIYTLWLRPNKLITAFGVIRKPIDLLSGYLRLPFKSLLLKRIFSQIKRPGCLASIPISILSKDLSET